jgi:hypothetical protein
VGWSFVVRFPNRLKVWVYKWHRPISADRLSLIRPHLKVVHIEGKSGLQIVTSFTNRAFSSLETRCRFLAVFLVFVGMEALGCEIKL